MSDQAWRARNCFELPRLWARSAGTFRMAFAISSGAHPARSCAWEPVWLTIAVARATGSEQISAIVSRA